MDMYLLMAFAFLAGFIDSMAGGGGLIQLPALMTFQPHLAPVQWLAINKGSSICGTAAATLTYLRKISINKKIALPCVLAAILFSSLGAYTVSHWSNLNLKPLAILGLLGVFLYTLKKKNLGDIQHKVSWQDNRKWIPGLMITAPIGFYDGFFGPGTGGFFTISFIRWLGFDFLKATALAKLLNFSTNLAAVSYFMVNGFIDYKITVPMALCNVAGGWTGSRLALLKGNQFVRRIFLIVSFSLISKLVYSLF